MDIGRVPSQGVITAASFTLPDRATRISQPQKPVASGDRLELSSSVDPDFANSVVQDTLQRHLQTAFREAGVEADLTEAALETGFDDVGGAFSPVSVIWTSASSRPLLKPAI